MKISEMTEQELLALPVDRKWEFLCGKVGDDGKDADYALLLGTSPEIAKYRAEAAAELYLQGRVKYVPSGGVEWEMDGERISEANYMKRILLLAGVPEEAIIMENEARTTKENMIYGALQINRRTKYYTEKRVAVVTSANHTVRSLALAKSFLPRFVELSAYPSRADETYESCLADPTMLDRELHLIHGLIHKGIVCDMEI